MKQSDPLKAVCLCAFDNLAGGGSLSVNQVMEKLSPTGNMTREVKALAALFAQEKLTDTTPTAGWCRSILDSWVGFTADGRTFTRTDGRVASYQLA